jgi:hypothetical protein
VERITAIRRAIIKGRIREMIAATEKANPEQVPEFRA